MIMSMLNDPIICFVLTFFRWKLDDILITFSDTKYVSNKLSEISNTMVNAFGIRL